METLELKHPTILFDFNVNGFPKAKGSLRPMGRMGQRVRLVEQVDPKKIWRSAVAKTARELRKEWAIDIPLDLPLAVRMIFRMSRPKKTRFTLPATRTGGDIDKLQRNIFDALQDAGVIEDDARAVSVCVDKVYAEPGQEPGVHVTLWAAA